MIGSGERYLFYYHIYRYIYYKPVGDTHTPSLRESIPLKLNDLAREAPA